MRPVPCPKRHPAWTGGGAGGAGAGASAAALPLSALECAVCLSLVCQPVSLSCGHTFCRLCLVNTLRRNKKQCPTCRAVCHNRSVNIYRNGRSEGGRGFGLRGRRRGNGARGWGGGGRSSTSISCLLPFGAEEGGGAGCRRVFIYPGESGREFRVETNFFSNIVFGFAR